MSLAGRLTYITPCGREAGLQAGEIGRSGVGRTFELQDTLLGSAGSAGDNGSPGSPASAKPRQVCGPNLGFDRGAESSGKPKALRFTSPCGDLHKC